MWRAASPADLLPQAADRLAGAAADTLAARRAVRRQAVDAAGVPDPRAMAHQLNVVRETADAALQAGG